MLHPIRIAILCVLSCIGVVPPAAAMSLQDAIYLYQQDFQAGGQIRIVGHQCDVFQLVLDVESGYTDLAMHQSNDAGGLVRTSYPDRIDSAAAMFSYMLYDDKDVKVFEFNDRNNPAGSDKIGAGTVFAYCLSSNPEALVYVEDRARCLWRYSDNTVMPMLTCPTAGDGPGGSSGETAGLVGRYTQTIVQTVKGGSCGGLTDDTSTATIDVTAGGDRVMMIVTTRNDSCSFDMTKIPGDWLDAPVYGAGPLICSSGRYGSAGAIGLKKAGGKLSGSLLLGIVVPGCDVTWALQ